jgi:DNA-directed RNA polymerase subunit RPC12/RpoP
MFGAGDEEEVTCPACGRTVRREDAREYDKHGDRFDRDGKSFEYLCQTCHDDLSLQGRAGLEDTLVEIEAGAHDDEEFLRRYAAKTEKHDESVGER